MSFFTRTCGGRFLFMLTLAFPLLLSSQNILLAQTDTNNTEVPGPGQMSLDSSLALTNAPPAEPAPVAAPAPVDEKPAEAPLSTVTTTPAPTPPTLIETSDTSTSVLAALLTLASIGGFLLYQCGLTRAKNSGHTATLLLVGVLFALAGYWIGGFAVQTGGIGGAHAALAQPLAPTVASDLNHELGFNAFGHYWGFMGSSGFFLATDDTAQNGASNLFLCQAALLAIAVAAALGAALERGRLLAMAICAYLIGVLIYPLLANWVWGGGWLASLGREFGLGHGFIDLGGAGVVHETAGTLALVIAVVLGPRHGRYGRNKASRPVAGHHVPFFLLGTALLLISWTATNAFAWANLSPGTNGATGEPGAGVAAVNTLLAAMGGFMTSFILASWQKGRLDPALLCRGLLGGAVASCGCAALIDPWAAFIIGVVASLAVKGAMDSLERSRIDDPVGASAVHGAAGAWGVIATGLFANGTAGTDFNGVAGPVRGLFFGGAWHQLAAQIIGCVMGFSIVCVLGYLFVSMVHKILGIRVELAAETQGLDWPELGALGYQGDVEPEE
jgi:Amt family ammonium transporter